MSAIQPIKFVIQRGPSTDEGTPGILVSENGVFKCATGELDWVDEDHNGHRDSGMSRCAAGVYQAVWGESPSRKNKDGTPEWTYRFQNVPDIAGMLIHSGNFCGRRDKGYVSDVLGCLILGADWTDIAVTEEKRQHANEEAVKKGWPAVTRVSQKGVSASRPTVAAFLAFTKKEPIEVTFLDYKG